MSKQYVAKHLSDLSEIGEDIMQTLLKRDGETNILLFYGEMGAGKTTLIRAMCESAGVEDSVTSPTFAIVNEYVTREDRTIFHFDFYRIDSLREVYDLGYEEYFFSGEICLIEWPSKIEEIIKEMEGEYPISTIHISLDDKNSRIIEFNELPLSKK